MARERAPCERAPLYEERGGLTSVALTLEPSGSVFVVFRAAPGADPPAGGLARNGKQLFSALPEPPVQVVVRSALYGVLDDPRRTCDVAQKVRGFLERGDYSFPVSALAEGDDPALNRTKTLAVGIQHRWQARHRKSHGQRHHLSHRRCLEDHGGKGPLWRAHRSLAQHATCASASSAWPTPAKPVSWWPAWPKATTPPSSSAKRLTRGHVEMASISPRAARPGAYRSTPGLRPTRARGRGPGASPGHLRLLALEPGLYQAQTAAGKRTERLLTDLPAPVQLDGPWKVRFAPNLGAPESATFDRLLSWTARPEPGIKYFSGAATYFKTMQLPPGML